MSVDAAAPSSRSGVGASGPATLASVPVDPWTAVRVVLVGVFVTSYLLWTRDRGIIVDRISVSISVGVFLVCAFAGKPWQRWALLVLDAFWYCLMWFFYDTSRGAADHLGFPVQASLPRDIDRVLFLGTDPSQWLQAHFFDAHHVRWYDVVGSLTYYSHFWLPIAVIVVLWARDRYQWKRFMKRFASVIVVACAMFVLMPTAPPWMATSRGYHYRLYAPLARPTARGLTHIGLKSFVKQWQQALDWSNAVAAMPSLHASFALLVPAFFLPWIRWRWARVLVLCFPVMMLTSLVYFGEHWAIDGFVGWALVGLSFLAWGRLERAGRYRRSDLARAALDGMHV
jgi:PAP2 superfamily